MRTVQIDKDGFILSGKRKILLMGSLFYFRVPRAEWRDRMEKLKYCGYHAIDVYFPWNHHEVEKGTWDFEGERDADEFLTMAEETSLYVIARPGPYICSEWDGGGLPAYLFGGQMKIRDNDPEFLKYTREWYKRVIPLISRHSYTKGGCVIAMQIENEYDFYSRAEDRNGYISALRVMTLTLGADMPLICCSGQSGLYEAGALHDGIHPAMNFYPDPWDKRFPQFLQKYQKWLSDNGYPLLITETNRNHQFLMTLLLCGAKLLGPYNQAGGTDFGFTNAVNNWGSPLSFQTSDYHFESMISPSGEINRQEMEEARLISAMTVALGEPLCKAQPCAMPGIGAVPDDCAIFALKFDGGGYLAGGTCYDKGRAPRPVLIGKGELLLSPGISSVCLLDLPLSSYGMTGILEFADAVPIMLENQHIVFASEHPVRIVLDGKKLIVPVQSKIWSENGIQLEVVPTKPSVNVLNETHSRAIKAEWLLAQGNKDIFSIIQAKKLAGDDWSMEKQGVLRGLAKYEVRLPDIRTEGVMLSGAADIISGYADGKSLGTFFPGGLPLYIPLPVDTSPTVFEVICEIWGHSNFDDSRLPALALDSLRGVRAIVSISDIKPLDVWRRITAKPSSAPNLMPFGVWQTSEMPCNGVFETEIYLSGDYCAIHFEGLEAILEAYVDGMPVGRADKYKPWLEIGNLSHGRHILRCTVTKRDFAEPSGTPVMYCGSRLNQGKIHAASEQDLASFCRKDDGNSVPLKLPLLMEPGIPAHILCRLHDEHTELTVSGSGIKASILRGGRLCGRLMLDIPGAPEMKGGRHNVAYLPASLGPDVDILIEAMSPGASLSSLMMRVPGTFVQK